MTQLVAPNMTNVQSNQISRNIGLRHVVLPSVVNIGQTAITYNPDLEVIEVLGGTLTSNLGFSYNSKLSTFVIRNADAAATVGANVFNGSKSSEKPIHVYVPAALKASYEAANVWASWVSDGTVVFHDLEGSAYESGNWWRDAV